MSDLHCNCSFRGLFGPPLPFALLEEELPIANLSAEHFQVHNYTLTLADPNPNPNPNRNPNPNQVHNYMRPEAGAVKDALVEPDPRRHLYFKSAFVMSHPMGDWHSAFKNIRPTQSKKVAGAMLY